MRTFLFWFAVLGPRARLLYIAIFGFVFYAIYKS